MLLLIFLLFITSLIKNDRKVYQNSFILSVLIGNLIDVLLSFFFDFSLTNYFDKYILTLLREDIFSIIFFSSLFKISSYLSIYILLIYIFLESKCFMFFIKWGLILSAIFLLLAKFDYTFFLYFFIEYISALLIFLHIFFTKVLSRRVF